MTSLQERLDSLHATIRKLASHPVTLVAVTKSATPAQIQEAYAAGLRDFGENKVQDALAKMDALPPEMSGNIRWHLIGPVQSNKVNKTLGRFYLIHSVDRLDMAEKLSAKNEAQGWVQPILLQVNISGEASKSGFRPEELPDVLNQLRSCAGLEVKGLMTMAPNDASDLVAREVFGGLRDLRDVVSRACGLPLTELSMGMSKDFVHALSCGATILRLGNLLFGSPKEDPGKAPSQQS